VQAEQPPLSPRPGLPAVSLELLLPAVPLEPAVVGMSPPVGTPPVVALEVPVEVSPIVEVPVVDVAVVDVPVEVPVVPPVVSGQTGASPPVSEVVPPSGGRHTLIASQVSSGLLQVSAGEHGPPWACAGGSKPASELIHACVHWQTAPPWQSASLWQSSARQ